MSQNLTISETGLKLIKAFEGYRPVDRELVTGQRIVGYGHRLYSEDAVMMDKSEAETVLRSDLEPFEDMINSEVHAPMSQSQFDALCSFAYNIGPKAFLKSDTLRALNNGRPLDAANGLDIWRKSEIAGKTYVVDALMRRRTAEKALFLRTERGLPAGREDLPPVEDTTIKGLSTEDALPVFTEVDANGIVATAPYEARIAPMRRREDGPAGTLQLSELDILEPSESTEPSEPAEDTVFEDEDVVLKTAFDTDDAVEQTLDDEAGTEEDKPRTPSPIAAAATDIVARLDALIEDADTDARFDDRDAEWPESLVSAEELTDDIEENVETETNPTVTKGNVIDLQAHELRDIESDVLDTEPSDFVGDDESVSADELSKTEDIVVIDELAQDDAFRAKPDSAAKYIQNYTPDIPVETDERSLGLGLWIPITLGFVILGAAAGVMVRGSKALLGPWGPIIGFTGTVIGFGLILTGIYAWLRIKARR